MKNQKTKEKIDRRSFLHSAAATGAGLVFSPAAFGQTNAGKKPEDINVALLGGGAQGQVLMNDCLRHLDGLQSKTCLTNAQGLQARA